MVIAPEHRKRGLMPEDHDTSLRRPRPRKGDDYAFNLSAGPVTSHLPDRWVGVAPVGCDRCAIGRGRLVVQERCPPTHEGG